MMMTPMPARDVITGLLALTRLLATIFSIPLLFMILMLFTLVVFEDHCDERVERQFSAECR